MSDRVRCHCRRCTLRGLMGPAVIITVGVLFLLQETHSGIRFGQMWPLILVVIGVISLASALAPMDGHTETVANVPPPGQVPPPPPPPAGTYSSQGR